MRGIHRLGTPVVLTDVLADSKMRSILLYRHIKFRFRGYIPLQSICLR